MVYSCCEPRDDARPNRAAVARVRGRLWAGGARRGEPAKERPTIDPCTTTRDSRVVTRYNRGMTAPSRERVRRHRARQRAGREVVPVEMDTVAVGIFLAIQGYPPDSDDRRAVGEALARALDVWARAC